MRRQCTMICYHETWRKDCCWNDFYFVWFVYLFFLPATIHHKNNIYWLHSEHIIVSLYALFQVSSTLSRMRGFPWAVMATCTSLMPYRMTVDRTTVALLPSPKSVPSSRKLPWLLWSIAVGLLKSLQGFKQNSPSFTTVAHMPIMTLTTDSWEV